MTLLKKLIYQSWHRGTRENDLLLGPFADAILPGLCEEELMAYQVLLGETDAQIFNWICGYENTPTAHYLIYRIQEFHKCR